MLFICECDKAVLDSKNFTHIDLCAVYKIDENIFVILWFSLICMHSFLHCLYDRR